MSGLREAAAEAPRGGIRGGVTVLLVAIPLVFGGSFAAFAQTPHLKAEQYKNLGVAYLEEDRQVEAERAFRRVIQLASDEALGYANLGIVYLRLGQLEAAASQLEQARRLDPANMEVLLLGAEVQFSAGQWEAVTLAAGRVLELDGKNAMARYYIYRAALAQRNSPDAQQTANREIRQLFRDVPDNLVVCLRYARLQAAKEDWQEVEKTLEQIQPATVGVEKAPATLQVTRGAIAEADTGRVENALMALENVLRPTAKYRYDLSRLQPPVAGLPLVHFSPKFSADLEPERPHGVDVQFQSLAHDELPLNTDLVDQAAQAGFDFADIDGDGREDWLIGYADGPRGSLQLWQNREKTWSDAFRDLTVPPVRQVRFVDFDSDGRMEVVGIGPHGLVMLGRNADGKWQELTPLLGKETPGKEALGGHALEIIDADNEGDLDLCLAGETACSLWQNRGDGTFCDISEVSGLALAGKDVRQVVATDHDDDLDTDLILAGGDGHLRLFDNRRHGRFVEEKCGLAEIPCQFVLTRDFDNDGYEDLLLIFRDGRLALQHNQEGRYGAAVMLPIEDLAVTVATNFDFDNDGWLDLAVAGRRQDKGVLVVLRNQGDGTWAERTLASAPDVCPALGSLDIDRDGDMDVVALDHRGCIRAWRNDGGNSNHWLRVELKGLRIAGSKNNLEGIGSKIEIKAGLFYEMRFVRRQFTHFGLGTHTEADLMRVVWSNGIPQNRLQPIADQAIREPQVLKGSCPYLYCWNGKEYVFVTDTLAGAPLGLQIAAGVVAPDNPRELLTIAREKIAPRDDEYIFQYTSELWETVYLDEVALWVIDHPPDIEVFTDQRFLPPPYVAPAPVLTRGRVMPQRAEETNGREVTARVMEFDHQYPEQLRATRYQGVVEPHCLTLQFGDVTGLPHPMLVLGCWIFWTDTSINVALSQDPSHVHHPTVVEVWRPETGWKSLERPFGLPNGKDKWVLVDVADCLYAKDARIRLRSESQIYWDQAFLVERVEEAAHRTAILHPQSANVHLGGFHQLYRPADNGPHLYDYGQQVRIPVWMDMTGLATRYGDVTELLTTADDRFTIFTGGDEVTIHFDASTLPPLPADWRRDFLFYSDGWEKDSDRNTICGETVEPLPFHAMSSYPYAEHERYPTDDLHRDYLRRYNTRRIGPDAFRDFVKQYVPGQSAKLPWDSEPGVRGDHSK